MEIFELILLMLSGVFISNVVSRLIPSISVPLIQVGLGICLAIPLSGHSIELNPELFLLLFMAPLLFNDGANVNKKALWAVRKPILLLSVGLVFLTVAILGYFIHWMIPIIPFPACFALAAALAPTDAIAVSAMANKIKISHKILNILEGESLINDASGLVSFQFAVAALITSSFSIFQASTSFLFLSLGGVVLGAFLSFLKILLMRWFRQLGIENTISFILMELLLPFLIFVVAEHFGVSGILAVVSGGIVHSFSYKHMNPEIVQLNLLSKNTWSVLTFSLNGLVFILLGTQIPIILQTVRQKNYISSDTLLIYILSITLVLLALRFIWVYFFNNFESDSANSFKSKLKTTSLYTISGVRGTITLVSALSLPIELSVGKYFLERDLLIIISAGVILTTLLLANFTLSLFAPKKERITGQKDYTKEIEILREVIEKIKSYQTEENDVEIAEIIHIYNNRILSLTSSTDLNSHVKLLNRYILEMQIEDTKNLLKNRQISLQIAFPTLKRSNKRLYFLTKDKRYKADTFYMELLNNNLHVGNFIPRSFEENRRQLIKLKNSNNQFVLEKLKELKSSTVPQEITDVFIKKYTQQIEKTSERLSITNEYFQEWLDFASQIEREVIQHNYEKGEINRNELKEFRQHLLMLENVIQFIE
ncbi:sodium:proton antiporter [Bacillus sp. AFS002410]|uniref:cation:proton antiporter n=1 Tax=Bacillus sp. AFS002410 TaxID=2033481 RepID=UPI000BF1ADC6|nr:sodium:proton antiporter [Bacillus sp. AFS002410]PEJ59024.1 sodium:proton antiporter [Bacillus sp. AFS002410]